MDVSLNSFTYGELACSEESSGENTKEITIDDVLKFIEEIVNRRRSMYERLSKLLLL